MQMKFSKREEAAFRSAGEPRSEPDYMLQVNKLSRTLTPEQAAQLDELLMAFAALVRYERRWYFHKGCLAAKKETK